MLKKVLVDCNVIIPSPPQDQITRPFDGSNYGDGSSFDNQIQSRRNVMSQHSRNSELIALPQGKSLGGVQPSAMVRDGSRLSLHNKSILSHHGNDDIINVQIPDTTRSNDGSTSNRSPAMAKNIPQILVTKSKKKLKNVKFPSVYDEESLVERGAKKIEINNHEKLMKAYQVRKQNFSKIEIPGSGGSNPRSRNSSVSRSPASPDRSRATSKGGYIAMDGERLGNYRNYRKQSQAMME